MKAQVQNSLFQVSEIKVSYHPKVKAADRPVVNGSQDAYRMLFDNWNQDRIELNEQFCILLLNRANYVIGMAEISSGGRSGTVIDAALIFGIALKCCASSMILCHNHPSGNLKPSQEDLKITSRLAQCGDLLGIKVLDHIILAKCGFYSFADEGLI